LDDLLAIDFMGRDRPRIRGYIELVKAHTPGAKEILNSDLSVEQNRRLLGALDVTAPCILSQLIRDVKSKIASLANRNAGINVPAFYTLPLFSNHIDMTAASYANIAK
jgi:hypothetical protein